MCYLTAFPPFVMPKVERLLNSLDSNDDGAGFSIALPSGEIITEHAIGITNKVPTKWKGKDGKEIEGYKISIDPTPMEDLCRRFVELRERHPEGPAMFHSRLATGGVEDTRGCHPFKVGRKDQGTLMSGTVLAHNGIMFQSPQGEWRSDTRIFAEDMLPKRFKKFWTVKGREKLEWFLGNGNKIVIITTNKRCMTRRKGGLSREPFEMFIFNEWLGHYTEDGAWHSNSSYEKFKTYRTGGYASGWDYDYEWVGGKTASTATATAASMTGSNHKWWDEMDEKDKAMEEGSKRTCAQCFAYAGVDVYTGICEFCNTCDDCGDLDVNCQCSVPGGLLSKPDSFGSAFVRAYGSSQVEPRAIESGKPAIQSTASPDEQRASFLKDCWKEFEDSDDPYVNAMEFDEFVQVKDWEVLTGTRVGFQSLADMNDFLAHLAAVAPLSEKDYIWWGEMTAQEEEEARNRIKFLKNRLGMATEVEWTTDPDDADGEPGIIRRLA